MDDVVRRCTGVLVGLSHCRHNLPQSVLTTLVQSLVVSMIRYGITVYGSCNQTQTARIQKLLNFCARVISGRRKFDHISDVLRDLKWLSAQNLHVYHSLMLLRRILTAGQPEALYSQIVTRREVHMRETRQAQQLHTPPIRSESGRRRFMYSSARAFNALPSYLQKKDYACFRSELRQHLLETQNE